MKKAHPGFKKVASGIAKQINPDTNKPYGKKAAGAILAKRTRNAPPETKKKNPRLARVKG